MLTRGNGGLDALNPVSIVELEALIGVAGSVVTLTGSRAGTFEWKVGDYSTEVAADTLQGVYVKATAVAATVGCWVRQYAGLVRLEWFGAVGDNVVDDWSAFDAARSMLNGSGGILLKADTTYYFATYRPDMSGVSISAETGGTLRITAAVDVRTTDIDSSVSIITGQMLAPYTAEPNDDTLFNPMLQGSQRRISQIPFGDWTSGSITGRFTVAAFSGTVLADTITFDPIGSGQHGSYLYAYKGLDVSVITDDIFATATAGYLSAEVVGDVRRYICAFTKATNAFSVFDDTGTVYYSKALSDAEYSPAYGGGGGTLLNVRVTGDLTAEIYFNGQLRDRFNLADFGNGDTYINRVGFASSYNAEVYTYRHPTLYQNGRPSISNHMQITVIGDSISYGAFSTNPWPDLLPSLLPSTELTMVNESVPGATTGSWIAGDTYEGLEGGVENDITYSLAGLDLSGDTFTVVALGTNDCQASVSTATFLANLQTIADTIVAAGSTPVFWTPPMFDQSVSYTAFNIALYAGEVREFCRTTGYLLIEANSLSGANIATQVDGIHPNPTASRVLAQAVADALNPIPTEALLLLPSRIRLGATYSNGWVDYSGTFLGAALERVGNTIRCHGTIKSGTAAPATVAVTVPSQFKNLSTRSFVVGVSSDGVSTYRQAAMLLSGANIEVWDAETGWLGFDFTWKAPYS